MNGRDQFLTVTRTATGIYKFLHHSAAAIATEAITTGDAIHGRLKKQNLQRYVHLSSRIIFKGKNLSHPIDGHSSAGAERQVQRVNSVTSNLKQHRVREMESMR